VSRSANGRKELGGMIKAPADSGSLLQFDNGQISLSFQVRDDKTQLHAIGATCNGPGSFDGVDMP